MLKVICQSVISKSYANIYKILFLLIIYCLLGIELTPLRQICLAQGLVVQAKSGKFCRIGSGLSFNETL